MVPRFTHNLYQDAGTRAAYMNAVMYEGGVPRRRSRVIPEGEPSLNRYSIKLKENLCLVRCDPFYQRGHYLFNIPHPDQHTIFIVEFANIPKVCIVIV